MIAAGAIVTCRQTGTILYIVKAQADDGIRWRLHGKRDDARGRVGRHWAHCRRRRSRPNPPGTHLLTRHHDRTHDEVMKTKHACETDLTHGALAAENM
jgi:hypothetical protein